MLAVTGDTVLIILVPTMITVLIALIGVLWKSGVDRGREQERDRDTDRRLTRIETRLFRNGGPAASP